MSTTLTTHPAIEFCGEIVAVERNPFTIGRDGDLVLDSDNRHLHRQFLTISRQHSLWLLTNVGSQLTATVSDSGGRLEAFLAPAGVIPLAFDETTVRFTAGPTNYEFAILLPDPAFTSAPRMPVENGLTTVGRVAMTPDQLRLILAIAEPALRGDGRVSTTLPTNQEVARRLGWTLTRVNRKLDNVCQKLAAEGIRGMHGGPGQLASNRRARLVEHAMAVQMVGRADLALLDTPTEVTDPVAGDDG